MFKLAYPGLRKDICKHLLSVTLHFEGLFLYNTELKMFKSGIVYTLFSSEQIFDQQKTLTNIFVKQVSAKKQSFRLK